MDVSPLANPKGVNYKCELCGKAALLQCKGCRVTFYCGHDHETLDSHGIHEKICPLLRPIRNTPAMLGSEEERSQRAEEKRLRQLHLLGLCKTEAHKKLYELKHDIAIPPALQALRLTMELYGQNSIELVSCYLLLGEASIGLKQFNQAEDYLSMAKWAVIKADNCDSSIRAQLHRNFGFLYQAQGNYTSALVHVAEEIYYTSLVNGSKDITTTGSYFHLGNVFAQQNQQQKAAVIYQIVIDIWKAFLKANAAKNVTLGDAEQTEAVQMLKGMAAFFASSSNKQSRVQETDCYLLLAQLYHYIIPDGKTHAKEYLTKAQTVSTQNPGSDSLNSELKAFASLIETSV